MKKLTLMTILLATMPGISANAKTYLPSNSGASETTKNIYNWIANLPNRNDNKILSGAFGGYANITGQDAFSMDEANNLYAQTSQKPAIYACDYARGWDTTAQGSEANLISYACNADLIAYWQQGGLVQISNHLPNPVFSGNLTYDNSGNAIGAYKTQITNDQLTQVLQEGTAERTRWLSIMDKVALGLQELKDAGVPVIYRPLHEMNGHWFWWGALTYNQLDSTRKDLYIKLYKDMYNYFTNTKSLNNLIWVYSPDAGVNYKTDYYPGTDYVDIVGLDMYLDNPDNLAGYDDMLTLKKPFALAEVGPKTTSGQYDYQKLINAIKSKYPKTTYFIPWNNSWSPLSNKNSNLAFNDASVVNLGEIWNGSVLTDIVEESASSAVFSFEGGTQSWQSNSANIGGYWSVNEWATEGNNSLKANITLADNASFTLKNSDPQDLSIYTSISATLKLASWGNVGSGISAKFYIKTGADYQWYDAGAVTLNNNSVKTATINLSQVNNKADIREIGVFFTTSNASGTTAVYIDNIVAN